MHILYIMCLYALRFVACKVSVDAFSLLYSKLILNNFKLQNCVCLYLVPILLNRFGNLLACLAALFVTFACRWLRVSSELLVRETQNIFIAVGRRSNPRLSRMFANSRLIFYCTFCCVFASVCVWVYIGSVA